MAKRRRGVSPKGRKSKSTMTLQCPLCDQHSTSKIDDDGYWHCQKICRGELCGGMLKVRGESRLVARPVPRDMTPEDPGAYLRRVCKGE